MSSLLSTIDSPHDIKGFNEKELEQLAVELREFMIDRVAQTGGHLAPSLGVVELVIALCMAFEFPRDKVIFDVGHQSYAYKILTGRREAFSTLRQWQGLAGFPKSEESVYDSFNTGHSSTSLSAALGMATARDLCGEDYQVVAVIGDGALTGGMAYEAMNNAGSTRKNLVVILNDNEMSISANVGAMANYLSRVRSDPRYSREKQKVKDFFYRRRAGERFIRGLSRLKDSIKYFFVRNVHGALFEDIGFTYLGPIDGHDIPMMRRFMENAKTLQGPVILHVITKKGKGYKPAEASPQLFHGVSPFDVATGNAINEGNGDSFSACFGKQILHMAIKDTAICAVTAAMPDGTGLVPFAERFPARFFDVGIAEPHAVTFGAGLAKAGLKPVVAIYSSFLQRSVDQIFHDVCLQKLPVTIAIDRSGVVGEDGETHQGIYDISLLRPLPNLTIMAPSTEKELATMLNFAVAQDGPCCLRYPRGAVSEWDRWWKHAPLAVGKGEMIATGEDVLLIPLGVMVPEALQVADMLAAEGLRTAILNPRFVKPLDEDLILTEMAKVPLAVTMEDHVLQGGFGSAVLELAQERNCQTMLLRCGLPDESVKHGKVRTIWEHYGIDAAGVAQKIKAKLRKHADEKAT